MKIIINATILDEKPTGIGVYTLNILNKISIKYSLFTSLDYQMSHVTLIKLTKYIRPFPYKKIGGIIRFFINQTYFTYIAKKYKIAYLPTPHGSLFLKNQIVTVHDLLALHFPEQHKLQYYYYKYFMPTILKKAKRIIAISNSTKNDLVDFYKLDPSKIKVIYNGFDSNHFTFKQHGLPLHNLLFSATHFKVSLNHYISI